MKLYLLLVPILILCASCSHELTREKAKELLLAKDGYPQPVYRLIKKAYLKHEDTQGPGVTINLGAPYDEVKDMLSYFQLKGMITLRDTTYSQTSHFILGTTVRTWTDVLVFITERGKQYLKSSEDGNYNVRIWDQDIGQVTGIQEVKEAKTATVTYTVVNDNVTPFGEYFSDKSRIQNQQRTCAFYDDGWRVQI